MNTSESLNKVLKNLIFPFISLLVSIILYFVFINPYFTYEANFENLKLSLEDSIKVLTSNLATLEKGNEDTAKLENLNTGLKSLVPDSANPSDLVGLIGDKSTEFRFSNVEENRNISSPENDTSRLIQVSFNGRSPGIVSSVNFIKDLTNSQEKLIKITKLELTNNPEELFTRVSFNAFSIYASPVPAYNSETPLVNNFDDAKFIELLNTF